jgi:hypothetical protein
VRIQLSWALVRACGYSSEAYLRGDGRGKKWFTVTYLFSASQSMELVQ